MKIVFTAGAKLLGVYFAVTQLVDHLFHLLNTIPYLTLQSPFQTAPLLGLFVFSFLFYLITSFVLLFRTDALANVLHIPDHDLSVNFQLETALRAGMILIGIYIFTTSISHFLSQYSFAYQNYVVNSRFEYRAFLHPAVQVILSLLLVFYANKITVLILQFQLPNRRENRHSVSEDS